MPGEIIKYLFRLGSAYVALVVLGQCICNVAEIARLSVDPVWWIVQLAFLSYGLYLPFLVWKRFSPAAVRNCCAILSLVTMALFAAPVTIFCVRLVSYIVMLLALYPAIRFYKTISKPLISHFFGEQEMLKEKSESLMDLKTYWKILLRFFGKEAMKTQESGACTALNLGGCCKVVAGLTFLLGINSLFFSVSDFLDGRYVEGLLFQLIPGLYFLYVGVVVLRNFSARAVRHCCVILSLLWIELPRSFLQPYFPTWVGLLSDAIFIYPGLLFYRYNAKFFVSAIFPEPVVRQSIAARGV